MFTLKAENKRGKTLELTCNQNYEVLEVTGLNPPSATVNMSSIANVDGKIFNSSKIGERNIVITIKIYPPVERNRIALYDIFQAKQYAKIYYTNDSRDVYTEGYIDSIECDLFVDNEVMQVSILCPSPFFKDTKEDNKSFSQVVGLVEFPISIPAAGQALSELNPVYRVDVPAEHDTGIIMTLSATGKVKNPVIYNTETRGAFAINYEMAAGDQIIVNTIKGEKSITFLRAGESTNIINYIAANPDWFQLEVGSNIFTYEAESGGEYLTVSIAHRPIYEGV